MLRFVTDVVFPPRCLGCASSARTAGPFCAPCAASVVRLEGPGCVRCGRPFGRDVEGCRDCPPEPIGWSRSAFLYAGPVRAGLIRLKFSGWRSAARALSPALASVARGAPMATIRPTVTWVPLASRRRRTRGFDQAEALARALGREAGWPVERLLVRVRETDPQARRLGPERRRALSGAFAASRPPPPFVVLVDDVLTTGATAAACAAALHEAGARRVGLVTVARALGGPVPGRLHPAA